MDEAEAMRSARILAARLISGQGDQDVASFLGLPIWVGAVRHPDVVAVEKALARLADELMP